MPKKLLIIAYYWPPAGGPGVQRWLKFVKYLPDFGVEPVVFVPEAPNYPIIDESLKAEVPKNTTVIQFPIKEPYKLAKLVSKKNANTISKGIIAEEKKQSLLQQLMLFVRGNFFIPDARKAWVKPATAFLEHYISEHNIDALVTTGPPHSMHLIGDNLKRKFNLKWIADFRDPWTTIGYHKQLRLTKASQKKHKMLERRVLTSADVVTVTSYVTKAEFEAITTQPIHVITNGYDNESVSETNVDRVFSISHIGSLLSKRNPIVLWEVLSELIATHSDFRQDFKLNFVGYVSDDVLSSLKLSGLSDYVNNIGYVSHKEAITFQKKSQILLLIEINSEDTRCIIPGKLFEYMVSNRPILAIGPKGSDVARIIKETNTGNYFYYSNKVALKRAILEYYNVFKTGQLKTQPIGLQKYHRKQLTKALSELI